MTDNADTESATRVKTRVALVTCAELPDLVVLRSPWDYPPRRDEFVGWACQVPRLANPAGPVAWNVDKRYLDALAGAGVPVAPTRWLAPGTPWTLPGAEGWTLPAAEERTPSGAGSTCSSPR